MSFLNNSSTKFLGVSEPVSLAHPDANDIKQSEALAECLQTLDLVESPAEMQQRMEVLGELNVLLKDWIREESKKKMPNEDCDSFGGKLFTFGSYRLGVHNRGADIDTLCVVPRHIDRAAFFSSFYEILEKNPNVADLHAVPDAFVPVMKLRFRSIELDLLFARIASKTVPDDQSLSDDMILKNLDDKSIRSLNGCRVADEILKAVPNQQNFVTVLRAVKHWAKIRGIYSNALGYFGGITWAILTARVCQLYPNAAPSKLLHRFFHVWSSWDWKTTPVYLKDSQPNPALQSLHEFVWNPRVNISDRYHLMPIITPAFPEQNSTHNVTPSTKTVICKEIQSALEMCGEILSGKATWSILFEEINFFTRYKHYLVIMCSAKNKADHLIYNGFVESKIRMLVGYLDKNEGIQVAHTNPKQFSPLEKTPFKIGNQNPVANLWFVALDVDVPLAKNLDLTGEIQRFMTTLCSAARDNHNDDMKVEIQYLRQKDVKHYISKEDMMKGKRFQKKKNSATPSPDTIKAKAVKRSSESRENSPTASPETKKNRQDVLVA